MKSFILTLFFAIVTLISVQAQNAPQKAEAKRAVPQQQVQSQPQVIQTLANLLVEKGQPNGKLSWKEGVVVTTVQDGKITNQTFLIRTNKVKEEKAFRQLTPNEIVHAFTTINYVKPASN